MGQTEKLVTRLVVCLLLVGQGQGAGSGRAFPIDSENYVTETFRRINPNIQWDPTNFLVDLAGNYANCNMLGRAGRLSVDQRTPDGDRISGYVDVTPGTGSDVDAVNGVIRTAVDRWTRTRELDGEIREAKRFGCSVRPACSGQTVISCLFSKSGTQPIIDCSYHPQHPDCQKEQPDGQPKALAFTPQQYMLAEKITGNRWDRSHFLENLSGQETDCAMITARDWPFATANQKASESGMRVSGLYGWSENRGSTPDALRAILAHFKEIRSAKSVGCSIIPDCVVDGRMYVVVSCLYQQSYLQQRYVDELD